MNTTTGQDTPPNSILNSKRWPLPWHRHNTRLIAANGAIVATFPVEGEALFGGGIAGVVERGDIIEQATGKHSQRRNAWLEKRVTMLESALTQSVAHWDSVISAEGEEFGFGVFDSVKDSLEDWRKLLPERSSKATP